MDVCGFCDERFEQDDRDHSPEFCSFDCAEEAGLAAAEVKAYGDEGPDDEADREAKADWAAECDWEERRMAALDPDDGAELDRWPVVPLGTPGW
jgi:hypothetical protein